MPPDVPSNLERASQKKTMWTSVDTRLPGSQVVFCRGDYSTGNSYKDHSNYSRNSQTKSLREVQIEFKKKIEIFKGGFVMVCVCVCSRKVSVGCRCYERLKTKTEGSKSLSHSGLIGEKGDLGIGTRRRDESFESLRCECVTVKL